jgi:hypothetical protein
MNTTTAAKTAKVTVRTIRGWARRGIITAIKAHGRWDINEASLTHRTEIAGWKTARRTPKPITYTIETMTAIGGNRWQRAGKDRVYINNWAEFAGVSTTQYKSGNISSASYQGEHLSNSQAYKVIGCIDKVWFDSADDMIHCRFGYADPRIGRDQVWDDVVTGIRTAIAAL